MKIDEEVVIKLELHEVSRILAFLKADELFEKALGEQLEQCFEKSDKEFKEGLKKYE